MLKKIKNFFLENASNRQTVAKNTFWLTFGQIAAQLLRTFIIIYAARILGAEKWGVFSYAITIAAFFSAFSDIGISTILTREAAKNPESRSRYISTSFFLKIILLIGSSLLIIFAAPYFSKLDAAKPLLPIVALIFIFDGLREFGFSINRAMEKMETEAFVKIFTGIATVIAGLIFLNLKQTADSLALAYLFSSIAGFAIAFVIIAPHIKNLILNFDRKLLRPILSSAWPIAISTVLVTILLSIDTIMLGWFKSAEDIGLYSAAQKPIQFFSALPGFFAIAILPLFSRLANKDNEKFRVILEKSLGLIYILALPLAVGGVILRKEVMVLLFGLAYAGAANAFALLLLNVLTSFPNGIIINAIFTYNRQRAVIWTIGIGAMLNIGLNLVLIPKYGIMGAAAATLLSQTLSNIFAWLTMKKINPFVFFPHIKKIAASTAVMGVATIFLKILGLNLYINLAVSIIVYFTALYLLKEHTLKEARDLYAEFFRA